MNHLPTRTFFVAILSFGSVNALLCQAPEKADAWLDVLKADARLAKPMTFNVKGKPGLDEWLDTIQKATGVSLSLAEPPENAKVVFGGQTSMGAPAWHVMRQMAKTNFSDGRWEKKGDGYALHGKPNAVITPEAQKEQAVKQKAAAETAAKNAALRKKFPLRNDKKLHPKFSVVAKNPTFAELIDKVREHTQLNITVADNLAQHDPKYGGVSLRDSYAWMFMEMIARKDLDDGVWQKTADGYHLVGTSRALRPSMPPTEQAPVVFAKTPETPFPLGWVIAAVVGVLFLTMSGFVIGRLSVKRNLPNQPSA